MSLPFTTEQFLEIFRQYNLSVYPIQYLFYLLAATVIWFSIRKFKNSDRLIVLILSFLFIWMGLVYHILYFATINTAAYVFGSIFVLQAILLLYYGVFKRRLTFQARLNFNGIVGILLIVYALFGYPVIGYFSGHAYPYSPTFGVPCPTLIFTYGIILWSDQKFPRTLLVIPLLWSIVGLSAVSLMGMTEDLGLLFSALITTILILARDKRAAKYA
jgi:hypothetical protein